MSHVFLCYARADQQFALLLAETLKDHDVPMWVDQWDIPFGANWDRTIDNALYGCARFLIILSPAAVESDEVQAELRTALDEKKRIIPVLYQECQIPRQLRVIQRTDFTSREPDDAEAIAELLPSLIEGSTPPNETEPSQVVQSEPEMIPESQPEDTSSSPTIEAEAQPPPATVPSFSSQTQQAQAMLKQLGFEPGPVDGIWGRKTELEVRDYQHCRGLPETGVLNDETMASLESETQAPPQPEHERPTPLEQAEATTPPARTVGPESTTPPQEESSLQAQPGDDSPPTEPTTRSETPAVTRRRSPYLLVFVAIGVVIALAIALYTQFKTITNNIGMEFVLIRPDTFAMGSPDSDQDADHDEKPTHEVTISQPFYLGRYEVTQAQWQAVMGNNPSKFKGNDRPVENVSWDDVQQFIQKLNEKEKQASGTLYRLPTEAEWEYAARAGTTTRYSFGDEASQLGDYAWYGKNAGNTTHPVGQKKPNPWGLHDMHGNVWEWVQDWHGDYPPESVTDPTGPATGVLRVLRGGSWISNGQDVRSANRNRNDPGNRNDGIGFRLARGQGPEPRMRSPDKSIHHRPNMSCFKLGNPFQDAVNGATLSVKSNLRWSSPPPDEN